MKELIKLVLVAGLFHSVLAIDERRNWAKNIRWSA